MPEGEKPGVFISHTSADASLANALGVLIKKVFAGGITPWFSSDQSPRGGIKPGEEWWDRIHKELSRAAQVFAVVTPRSMNKPWIYWESGIGSIACDGKVTPIVFRVDIAQLGPPLSYLEALNGLDQDNLKDGILKVGAEADLSPDAEIVTTCVTEFVATAEKALEGVDEVTQTHVPDPLSALYGPLQNIAERMDRLDSIPSRLSRMEEGFQLALSRMLNAVQSLPEQSPDPEIRTSHRADSIYEVALQGSESACSAIAERIASGAVTNRWVRNRLSEAASVMPDHLIVFRPDRAFFLIMEEVRRIPTRRPSQEKQ